MKIRKFRKNDVIEASNLIYKTFKQYNGRDYFTKDAIKNTLKYFDVILNSEQELVNMFARTPISFVAEENGQILGVIRGNPQKVTSLMVSGIYHKKKIGLMLLNKFEAEALKQKSTFIKIKSSLFAVPFYEKCGYKKTTGIRNFEGLKVINMKKVL